MRLSLRPPRQLQHTAAGLVTVVAVIALFAAVAPGEDTAETTRGHLDEIAARWEAYLESLPDLTRQERAAQARAFFDEVSWELLDRLCRRESAHQPGENERALRGLVMAKLDRRAASAETLASFVRDLEIASPCKRAIIMSIAKDRDKYRDRPPGQILADAFLELARSGTQEQAVEFSLERAATYLWASDTLMDLMVAHCHSGDPTRVGHGISMLMEALDERAGGALLDLVSRLAQDGTAQEMLVRAMSAAADRTGGDAFDTLLGVLKPATDRNVRRHALIALARTEDPRSHSMILGEYPRAEAGIADSTHAIADAEERGIYYYLWFATRLAEPSLIRSLREGDAGEVDIALDLLDRESRFGLPASPAKLYAALDELAASAGGDRARHVGEILSRFRSYAEARAGAGR